MPCYQSTNLPSGVTTSGRTSYQTEADCLQACKEGACCEGTTCSVKPQCQCQGTGKTFKGVGTTCTQFSGACYETVNSVTNCIVKSQCACQGAGKVFAGVGTNCDNVCCACATFPKEITITASFSGFSPVTNPSMPFWEYAKDGSPARNASWTFGIACDSEAGLWTTTTWPEALRSSGDTDVLQLGAGGVFSAFCRNVSFVDCGAPAVTLMLRPTSSLYRWRPGVPNGIASGCSNVQAWQQAAAAAGVMPGRLCWDVCGSGSGTAKEIIRLDDETPFEIGEWTITATTTGCQNPLP